jgi:cbb3-type cytochrome oxidase cytochrome c subunit
MNHGPLIFLGVFAAFIASWWGMVFAPHVQIGSQKASIPEGALTPYPAVRPGLAAQGLQSYVANGCVYCHSQQVRQDGYTFEVVFAGTTNQQATAEAFKAVGVAQDKAAEIIRTGSEQNAVSVKKGVSAKEAARIQKALSDAGATAQTVFIPTGADMARGWGLRQSVAADYLQEYPVQIGNSRLGPDLANVGARQPDAQWHLRHLYDPRTEVKGSIMPAYRYLFETRKAGRAPSPNALKLPAEFAPPAGYEVVPTEEAMQLVAYLQSLVVTTPLFEAPMTVLPKAPPAGDTNAPAGTNAPAATNAAAANTPKQ